MPPAPSLLTPHPPLGAKGGGGINIFARPKWKKIKNWMLNILAFLWTFSGSPKSKNDALVCFKPVSKPGAYGPSIPGILLSQDQSWGQTVTLQAHRSQIPTRVKAEIHSSCLFSGFRAATFTLIISCSSGEMMGCHSDRKKVQIFLSLT